MLQCIIDDRVVFVFIESRVLCRFVSITIKLGEFDTSIHILVRIRIPVDHIDVDGEAILEHVVA